MAWTTKLLVIANRTVGSDELLEALRARAGAGPIEVTLVAPAETGRVPTAERLERAVGRLRDDGITVKGSVGHPDPLVAFEDVWDPRMFDEVIVATLPTGVSRWMAIDLPHRISRVTGARVTRVVASDGAGRGMRRAHA
jgi:GABA permease